jgi:replicative DNA helicase
MDVKDKYRLRKLLDASAKNIQSLNENQDDVDKLIDEAEQRIFAVSEDRFKGEVRSMKDNAMRALEIIESCYKRKGGLHGLSTGFHGFDQKTGGLHNGEMT